MLIASPISWPAMLSLLVVPGFVLARLWGHSRLMQFAIIGVGMGLWLDPSAIEWRLRPDAAAAYSAMQSTVLLGYKTLCLVALFVLALVGALSDRAGINRVMTAKSDEREETLPASSV